LNFFSFVSVVATFDADQNGEVDFAEFIQALSVFATTETKEKKFKC
jgi:Ca2+-binding EF-hand superfamily protein